MDFICRADFIYQSQNRPLIERPLIEELPSTAAARFFAKVLKTYTLPSTISLLRAVAEVMLPFESCVNLYQSQNRPLIERPLIEL